MWIKTLGAAAAAMLFATSAQAVPQVFQFSASAPWSDPFSVPAAASDVGSISGSFTVDDDLGFSSGEVETVEVTAFSLTSQGFVGDLAHLNFTVSSAAGGLATVTAGTPQSIGAGLSVAGISFADSTFSDFIDFDLNFGPSTGNSGGGASIQSLNDPTFVFARPETTDFTITPPNVIPLPAPIAMMLGGLAAFGAAAYRRRGKR